MLKLGDRVCSLICQCMCFCPILPHCILWRSMLWHAVYVRHCYNMRNFCVCLVRFQAFSLVISKSMGGPSGHLVVTPPRHVHPPSAIPGLASFLTNNPDWQNYINFVDYLIEELWAGLHLCSQRVYVPTEWPLKASAVWVIYLARVLWIQLHLPLCGAGYEISIQWSRG